MDVQRVVREGIKLTNFDFGYPEGQTMQRIRELERQLIFLDNVVTQAGPQFKGAISKVWYPFNLKKYHKLAEQGDFKILDIPKLYCAAIEHYKLVCNRYNL